MSTTLEERLGFDKICDLVAAECTNPMAVRMAHEMSFSTDYDRVMLNLHQTEEFRQILLLENSFPSQDFFDLTEELTRLRVGNTVIELESLVRLRNSLHTLGECLRFLLRDDKEGYPHLRAMAQKVELDPSITKMLSKLIDDRGELRDDASPMLADIRSQMRRKSAEVDTKISRTLAHAKHEGWAPENGEVTIRNGRLVIPMLDTHRRKIKGFIHDESATRQTAYLEPSEVVELNNDLRELEFAERHEIQKILAHFSDMIRPQILSLVNAYWFLARIDFIRAKARFALTLHAGLPNVSNETQIDWHEARHPLLMLAFQKNHNGEEVVPFDIVLNEQSHILIISGPNAGGKSVCLKAVGLIQYMLQAGMLVPIRETSECGIFDNLFIDIGDQQSLENDLSTYTSHLQNMKELLSQASAQTLFLLDELGGGTEPRSGCAIAEALLEELYLRGSYGVVTTHFSDLKLLADTYPGIANGAMLFDTHAMRPLYRLSIGHPGSSFAFEIARNVGFPAEVLVAAEGKVGTEMLNFEHQLQQMELDKRDIERRQQELEVSDNFLNEVIQKYQRLNEQLESKKHEILSQARSQARQILTDANRTVEQTISDIKTAQAEKEKTAAARASLHQQVMKVEEEQMAHDEQLQELKKSSPAAIVQPQSVVREDDRVEGTVAVGDIVRIDGNDSYGEVVEIKGKKAVVESNSLRMTIALSRLTKTKKQHLPTDKRSSQNSRFQSIYDDINEKRKFFSPKLDLRGHRAEEALDEVSRFLDEAQLLGEKELRILHGKGYGILKTLIRQQLSGNHDVESFHSERLELGGDGITVVHLK